MPASTMPSNDAPVLWPAWSSSRKAVTAGRLHGGPLPSTRPTAVQGGGGIQRQQTAFAVADHSEIALDLVHEVERAHAVDSGQDLLHLKPDDVPAHFERGTVDELAMRLVGRRPARNGGVGVAAVDEQ